MVSALNARPLIIRGTSFLLVWALLNVAAWQWGDSFASAVIPLYKTSFTLLTDHYDLQTLRLESQREPYFKIAVKTVGSRVLNGTSVPNNIEITSQTLQGHAFQPIIVALSLLLIWPLRKAWHRGLVVLMAVPILLFILGLDVPLVFLGSLEDLVLANYYPEALSRSFAVHTMQHLNGGGRLMLGVIGATLSVALSHSALALFQKYYLKQLNKFNHSLT